MVELTTTFHQAQEILKQFPADAYPLIFMTAIFVIGAIVVLATFREKVNWKFVVIYSIIYFFILFLDMGSSTPYVMASCGADAVYEHHPILRYTLANIGWYGYPIGIAFNMFMAVGFLINANFLSNCFHSDYKRGFAMALFNVIIAFALISHVTASIHNFTLC